MKLILGLCVTSSKHKYKNLLSYIPYIDGYVIYYNDLPIEELELIKQHLSDVEGHYYEHNFDGNFSNMRNECIALVNKHYGQCNIIMPDDSMSIHNFSKSQLLNDYKYYICDCYDDVSKYVGCKIFKSNSVFEGKIREKLKINSKKDVLRLPCYFQDHYLDYARSSKYVDNDPYYVGRTQYHNMDYENAFHNFVSVMNSTKYSKECKFKTLLYMYHINRDVALLEDAIKQYPPRKKEALYYLNKHYGDNRYLDEIRNTKWGNYCMSMSLELKSIIDKI